MGRRIVPLLLCGALLAGCGGDDEDAAPQVLRYARQPTIACLKEKDFRISTTAKDVGFIAFTSVGGGLRARKGARTDVIMAFGADGDDAAQTMDGIKKFRKTRESPIFRFRLRKANVVILWAYRPTDRQKKNVYGCLKPAAA